MDQSRALAEKSCRIGLLSRGAASAAQAVLDGKVPYYETLPQIEVLGTITSWAKTRPHGMIDLPYWVDALHGIEELVGGRRLLHANRKFKHSPELPNLKIQRGQKAKIEIAFGGKNVRQIVAEIPGTVIRQEPVSLRVEYRLGSGCPTVTINRERHPTEPIVFHWDTAEAIPKSRDELSTLDPDSVKTEHKRREQRRLDAGFQI
ncbi:MAG: hypothetical protein O7D97_10260 [Planctomycetota bacterium]|nr:hypothetical protein [Planctomycetota bacterium]